MSYIWSHFLVIYLLLSISFASVNFILIYLVLIIIFLSWYNFRVKSKWNCNFLLLSEWFHGKIEFRSLVNEYSSLINYSFKCTLAWRLACDFIIVTFLNLSVSVKVKSWNFSRAFWRTKFSFKMVDRTMYGIYEPGTYEPYACIKEKGCEPGCKLHVPFTLTLTEAIS